MPAFSHESNGNIPDSLFKPSVDELAMANLSIIQTYSLSPDSYERGVPLELVPRHYQGGQVSQDLIGTVAVQALDNIRSFFGASETVVDAQPYGEARYWSFDHNDRKFYVTETRLYPGVSGVEFQASPISAGLSMKQPDRMREIQLTESSNIKIAARNHEVFVKGGQVDPEIKPEDRHNDIFAKIGRFFLRAADKIDPTR